MDPAQQFHLIHHPEFQEMLTYEPNRQPREVRVRGDAGFELDVFDIWPTIQGEGPFAGAPAVFVRLAGCNLRCPLCDTDYTSKRVTLPIETITERALSLVPARIMAERPLIVITGGEPFRQPIAKLCRMLWVNGFNVQIETNGTMVCDDFKEVVATSTIVCSPKTRMVHASLGAKVSAWKYVLEHGRVDNQDGLPLSVLGNFIRVARPTNSGIVYVQPLDEKDDEKNRKNLEATVCSAQQFGYRICLQLHKLLGME